MHVLKNGKETQNKNIWIKQPYFQIEAKSTIFMKQ